MQLSAYDLKSFYTTHTGRVVRRTLQAQIRKIWPDIKGQNLLGCGYALPYLGAFMDESTRITAILPASMGAHHWPRGTNQKNLTCLAEQSALPIETNSIDRVIMIHDLEFSETLPENLAEIWRVLKPNGRILVITPNRSGLWARADWSPFGQGRPYSKSQLCRALDDNMFTHESTRESLFVPPLRYEAVLKLAGFFERLGGIIPIAAGVHIVEASKQIYARTGKGHGARSKSPNASFIPKPAISTRTSQKQSTS